MNADKSFGFNPRLPRSSAAIDAMKRLRRLPGPAGPLDGARARPGAAAARPDLPHTAHPELTVSGGKGAHVSIGYAEALVEPGNYPGPFQGQPRTR
jgi:hypothetical protein